MANSAIHPRLILWDVDHTLIETRGAGGQFARAAFEEITGIRPEHVAEATGKTEPVILAETLRAHGIELTDTYQRQYAQALPAQYRRHVDQLRTQGRALPGAAEAIAALHQIPRVIQTVLTGNYKAVAATKLAAFDLDRVLDLDVGAYADEAEDRAALVAIAQRRAAAKYDGPFTRANTRSSSATPPTTSPPPTTAEPQSSPSHPGATPQTNSAKPVPSMCSMTSPELLTWSARSMSARQPILLGENLLHASQDAPLTRRVPWRSGRQTAAASRPTPLTPGGDAGTPGKPPHRPSARTIRGERSWW